MTGLNRRRWWLFAPLLLSLAGCGRAKTELLCQVTGKLLIDDQPAANASLAFHPVTVNPAIKSYCPVAVTQADGTFRLTTRSTNDGAPAGEYSVTVVWPDHTLPFDECACEDLIKHDRLRGRYASRTQSPLRVMIRPECNPIDLTAMTAASVESDKLTGR